MILGFLASLVAGILAIKLMLKVLENIKLYWFSIYLFLLSAGLIVYLIIT